MIVTLMVPDEENIDGKASNIVEESMLKSSSEAPI
jgi:hypothetical protein